MLQKFVISPMEKFIKIESFSGILLFFATIIALVWANSPLGHYYESIWSYKLGIQISNYELIKPLILWINDGLMAIFFFLIGLEIKRELTVGELNTPKKAIFPLFAAVGGVAIPGLLFYFLNDNPETLKGWAIPMATDIAFSLAIIKLLGDRVSLSVKIFLTALAIVDDLVAVMIIALFYSGGISWMYLVIALALLAIMFLLSYLDLFSKYLHLLIGFFVWWLFLKAGIHPTIAGVLLAFVVPIERKIRLDEFTESLDEISGKLRQSIIPGVALLNKKQIEHIDSLDDWLYAAQSPLQYLEHKLHDWVAYVIMPIFALSNAGVTIQNLDALNYRLIISIAAALFVGKSIGIYLLSNLAIWTGASKFPDGLNRKKVLGVSFLAGVGFTMSIFIANLAFSDNQALLDSAKIGIIIGSLLSGVAGYVTLRLAGTDE
jgi:NhaA family Na+:H+ antiporter